MTEQTEIQELEDPMRRAHEPFDFEVNVDGLTSGSAVNHHRRQFAVGGLVLLSAVLIVALLVWSPFGAQPAFGWTMNPSVPSPEDAAAINAICSPASGGLSLKVIDQRGEAAAAYYGDGNDYALCLTRKDSTGWIPLGAVGAVGAPSSGLAPKMTMATPALQGTGDRGTFSLTAALGTVPTDTQSVQVTLTDGSKVDASVANGTYVAWWPGQVETSSATAYGLSTAPIECTVLTC